MPTYNERSRIALLNGKSMGSRGHEIIPAQTLSYTGDMRLDPRAEARHAFSSGALGDYKFTLGCVSHSFSNRVGLTLGIDRLVDYDQFRIPKCIFRMDHTGSSITQCWITFTFSGLTHNLLFLFGVPTSHGYRIYLRGRRVTGPKLKQAATPFQIHLSRVSPFRVFEVKRPLVHVHFISHAFGHLPQKFPIRLIGLE